MPDLYPNAVTIQRATWSNVRGVRTATYTSSTAYASVQSRRADRVFPYDLASGETGYVVYFAANPNVKPDDRIVWGSLTLSVLAPASDEAGRGLVFSVDCKVTK